LSNIEEITVVDGLLEDITERKQATAALEQLNATLEARVRERTTQLEAVNQDLEEFAYWVSHDLRAPLRVIQRFAQLFLEEGEPLSLTRLRYIQRIGANASQMNTLITDLLTYSRLKQTQITLERANLSLVFQDVQNQLEAEIQKRQAIITIENPLPIVQGNYLILVQVLTNLLFNAIKFVAFDVQPQIRVWACQRESQTRLWIEDNGIGIALDKQQQIFNPFARLHSEEEYPGTGIGLAIVRKGVERMGGQVGVESHNGQGSRFWIELPTVME
jgi:signal transduction histidine kinase